MAGRGRALTLPAWMKKQQMEQGLPPSAAPAPALAAPAVPAAYAPPPTNGARPRQFEDAPVRILWLYSPGLVCSDLNMLCWRWYTGAAGPGGAVGSAVAPQSRAQGAQSVAVESAEQSAQSQSREEPAVVAAPLAGPASVLSRPGRSGPRASVVAAVAQSLGLARPHRAPPQEVQLRRASARRDGGERRGVRGAGDPAAEHGGAVWVGGSGVVRPAAHAARLQPRRECT